MSNEDRIAALAGAMELAQRRNAVRNATLKEPEWWRQTLGSNIGVSGHHVTTDTALTVTAVFACVRVLAESVASLPLMVYKRLPGGGKEVATEHPLYPLLHASPNRDQTAFEAGEFRMASLALRGNSFSHVERNGFGVVSALHPLRTAHMHVKRDAQQRLVFDYREPGAERVYAQDEIWFTRAFGSDGVIGLSPIGVCRDAVSYALTLNEHGSRMFTNGAKVPGVLEVPGEMSDVAYKRLTEDFASKHEGHANAGRTLILEGGTKYTAIGMNAADAEFIAVQRMQIAEIARIFRVPLHMINELDKATFSNIEHQSLEFVTHTLRPWLVRQEQSANRDLFGPGEAGKFFVEYKLDALLRGDIKSRYEAYASGITNGWITRNEVRSWENLNPEEGLDELLVPLNMRGANEAPPEPKPADNKLAAQVKAIRIERARLNDAAFESWATDYYKRLGETAGADYADKQLAEILALGADAAIAKWTNGVTQTFNIQVPISKPRGYTMKRDADGNVTATPTE